MWRKAAVVGIFVVIVGGALATSKKSDAEVLTQVGRKAVANLREHLPERSRVAGPVAQVTLGEWVSLDEKVRLRLRTDAGLQGAAITVTAKDDEITLSGRVTSTTQIEQALSLAQSTVGVKNVKSELAVSAE
jgi:osmotically-inducible protein OsmY